MEGRKKREVEEEHYLLPPPLCESLQLNGWSPLHLGALVVLLKWISVQACSNWTSNLHIKNTPARPLLTRAIEDGNYDTLVDPKLQRDYNIDEVPRIVVCAAACVRHSARRRPRLSQVVRDLEGDASLSDLNEGIRPGHSTVYSSHGSSDYDTSQYKDDMRNFRKLALASQDYPSSDYSRPTSEYGLYPSGSSSEGHNTREMELGKAKKDSQGFSGES